MKLSILLCTCQFAGGSLALASQPSLAAPDPTPSPVVETYGSPVGEPTLALKWSVYLPAGAGPWPAVLVIHAGGFKHGSRNDDEVVRCAHDLADAGFLALAISYRLAPPGQIEGQRRYNDDGRYPEQTADVQMAIRAARADPRANGLVGAVGGSAGATHTAVAAATGRVGNDRLDVGVCLSGTYNFADFTQDIHGLVEHLCTNYVGSFDPTVLLDDSPVSIVDRTVSPLFLANTEMDPQPLPQLLDMIATLKGLGVTNYDSSILPGNKHAFDYWEEVKGPAIKFLKKGFAQASQ